MEIISKIKVIQNPTKQQVINLLNEDKYHILRGFITEKDLYCWRGYRLTHEEAKKELLKQEGINLNPICGIAFNENNIQLANSWNNDNISNENKTKALHNPQLEYLFGKDYVIVDLQKSYGPVCRLLLEDNSTIRKGG